ncbi:complement component C9 [Eublepharis macularius]|uniref:Complement component C9 n=1 Tax=Eublepharis macularius TaxID=481883 RepID=A0AA97JR61_EUBMA|nr:complement component C9 [Eublepharis macularius]XP_054842693.1 complement component C9 [Eublepharis macularius]
MHTFLPLIGVLCILHANSFVWAGKRSFSEQGLRRVTREPGAPPPIDCLLSQWSEWGPCNPCGKERYRSRSVLQYGQFGGNLCSKSLGENQRCETDQVCPEEEIDCGNDFRCENGLCIKQRLVCNTEDDCGDFSDEDNCDDAQLRPPCRDRVIDVSEIGRKAGRGINVLGMQPKDTPFYNEFYNGLCNRERDGNTGTYYRKPWNVAVLNYETKGDKSFSSEQYENHVTAVREMYTEKRQHFQSSFSLKIKPTEVSGNSSIEFNSGRSGSRNMSINQLLKESNGKEQTFLHMKGMIELGNFQMRSRDVRLSDTFLEDLKYLPSDYDMGEYFKFLEMHGTHYARKGTVGGKYELLYVLDNQNMRKEEVSVGDVKACLGYNDNLGFKLQGVGLDLHWDNKGGECSTDKLRKVDNSTGSAVIHGVISRVQGGTSVVLAKLEEKLSRGSKMVDVEDYVQWAATLPDAPAVIESEPYPISALVPVKMHDSYIKKQNLDRAVEDYIAEYSVCKCQPCQNGGTVVLVNGECICGCTSYFKGVACQIPKSSFEPAQVATDGSWSCWSTWSTCTQGERTRTRQCNNPAPGSGGKPCAGAALETGSCQE